MFNRKKKEPEQTGRQFNTSEENELLDIAQERFTIARAEKKDLDGNDLHSKWKRLDRIYRGQQWDNVPEGKSAPVINITFSLIESIVPRLTDVAPEIRVFPRREPRAKKLADSLTAAHKYIWDFNDMDRKLAESTRIFLKLGTSIIKVFWDWDKHDGLGEVAYSVIHPMNFFPDPKSHSIEFMDFCFTTNPRSLDYIKRRWPEKGKYVVPDTEWQHSELGDGSHHEIPATVTEYWFRDANGNVCVMYYCGDVVLEVIGGSYDGSNEPVYRHNRFPFVRLVNYPLDKKFWGLSEIEIVENLQRLINSFEAQIVDSTRLMANPIWKVNKRLSGLTEEDAWIFDNTPGNVLWTMDGGVERERGVEVPAHVIVHQERLMFAMEQILGIHDVVQGRKPSGVRAASAIIALQEAANVRVRQKAKELQHAVKEMAEMANWLILEFYDKPRQLRVTGEQPYVTLDVHEALREVMAATASDMGMIPPNVLLEELEQPAERFEMKAPSGFAEDYDMQEPLPDDLSSLGAEILSPEPAAGGLTMMDKIMQEVEFPEFDVEVRVGPSVPYSQALLYQQALEFFQAGIIDEKAVLDVVGFPNRDEILMRMEQKKQAMQQALMQQQQETQQPQGAPGVPWNPMEP
ncbi:MAG TPA: hypothetical protein PKI14_07205 [Fervidobacterium sp.]|nr:hypothetical protein [Fervidobacterium sp.]